MHITLFLILSISIFFVDARDVTFEWQQFKIKYNKSYDSAEEELSRLNKFVKNLKKIEDHNGRYIVGLETFELGITKFADLTREEFMNRSTVILQQIPEDEVYDFHEPANLHYLPSYVNWTAKGAVGYIKNQGDCGSCWSFASLASLEGIYFLKTGNLYDLSEQNLIDCSVSYGNNGCTSGYILRAYKYIRDEGIMLESDYSYRAKDGYCQFNSKKSVLNVQGTKWVRNSEEALQEAVASVGPVAVSVDASEWYLYKGGIMKAKEPFIGMTHSVAVVGYGTENGEDYWLIKNSYGPDFGEDGYVRTARNRNNMFGISSQAKYPIV